MKVMVLGKATERSEAGEFGTAEEFAAMDQFNEQLVEAGVVLAADGLQPTSKGKRVAFDADGNTTVIDGPCAEPKDLVARCSRCPSSPSGSCRTSRRRSSCSC